MSNAKYTEEDKQKVRDISIAHALSLNMHREKMMICCPMPNHNDSSPSFLLDDENGYYCFGCNVQGRGFIDFLTDMGEDFNTIMKEYG